MSTSTAPDGLLPLTHWGLLRARGDDAASFLQGQLTNDVAGLTSSNARLAGFCSAKGRLQASFIVWRLASDDFLLACAASVLPATLKRLAMFVLRAKCRLSDASSEFSLLGAVGTSASGLIGDAPVWGQRALAAGSLVRLPDQGGVARCILAMPPSAVAPALPALRLDAWRTLEVASGLPLIEAATVDQFVPQMLNFELIGGVDFRKGCYPGQEVVARSQYRGTIKRRMFLFDADALLSAGQEVYHSADAAQPAGMVVNAAASPDGEGSLALVEVKLAAMEAGSLHAGSVDGPELHRHALPYAVPVEAPAG